MEMRVTMPEPLHPGHCGDAFVDFEWNVIADALTVYANLIDYSDELRDAVHELSARTRAMAEAICAESEDALVDAEGRKHGMIPGSHERAGGPECRCGAAWLYFEDRCAQAAKETP
jgi:hypothetical protein